MIYILVALEEELPSNVKLPDNYTVIYTDIGKINATYTTCKIINIHNPEKIINYGTVGSINPNIIGLVQPGKIVERDMIADPWAARGVTPQEQGNLNADIVLDTKNQITLGTGDSFVQQLEDWFIEKNIDIVDMEAYSIAKVCLKENVPFMCYKFVSDFADKDAAKNWKQTVSLGYEQFLHVLN